MKYDAFDLNEVRAGAEVITRDGSDVRILCFDRNDKEYPIVGLIDNIHTASWSVGGSYSLGTTSSYDIFIKPKFKKVFHVVYEVLFNHDWGWEHEAFDSRDAAVEFQHNYLFDPYTHRNVAIFEQEVKVK